MEKTVSDMPDVVPDESVQNFGYEAIDILNMNGVISDLKKLIDSHDDPSHQLTEYLNKVEKKIDIVSKNELLNVDKGQVKMLIEKHPFFKNPNTYAIRLITIMKYIKKKGTNINVPDMDLLVDEIIMSINGVTKVGYGKYSRIK
ncbi:MAG: hypothetical protein WBA54_14805 [Acidaminobacteraceae bacterium]